MPRPKTANFWVAWIRKLDSNEPRMSHAEMLRRLQVIEREKRRDDCPADRTIRTIRKQWKHPSNDEERLLYRYVHWPESFQNGVLPWAASAAALELLRLFRPYETGQRPTIRLVVWFWRITQAAPDAPVVTRRGLAGWLAAAEALGGTRHGPPTEAYLVYRVWTPEGGLAQAEAQQRGQVPAFPELDRRALSGPEYDDLLTALIGPETAEDVRRLRETMERIEAQRQTQKGESS